ncbi:MAG: hypothetical protein HYX34_06725 [Actinobacteria bacterium]|nr:hypothetical protein [Actinomycetota bacterium]
MGATGRIVAGAVLAVPGTAALVAGAGTGISALAVLGGAAVAAGVVRGATVGVDLGEADISVRNGPFRQRHLTVDEIAGIEPGHWLGLPLARIVPHEGRPVPVAASLSLPGRQDPELHLELRRWSRDRGIPDRLNRVELKDRSTRASLLRSGEEVAVPCHARRTTTRGWGPWVRGWLRFRGGERDDAAFVAAEPEKLDLVRSKATTPTSLAGATSVTRRRARFKEEAFEGRGTDIVVVQAPRMTLELALPHSEIDACVDRLERANGLSRGEPPPPHG